MTYKTVKAPGQDEFLEKRSRFIGYVRPVATQEEAMAFVEEIRSRHWDATHNVYAYILREGMCQRYSDDGEPQGTAGVPVLDVLRKEDLTDVAVVVTRYFGGTLLGAGGLVRAYSHGAKLAVDAGGVVEMTLCKELEIVCGYEQYARLNSLIFDMGGRVEDTRFLEQVTLRFYLPENLGDAFRIALTEATCGQVEAREVGQSFHAV